MDSNGGVRVVRQAIWVEDLRLHQYWELYIISYCVLTYFEA
jgi:hypothetical protein